MVETADTDEAGVDLGEDGNSLSIEELDVKESN